MIQKSKYQNWWRSLMAASLLVSYCTAFLLIEFHSVFLHNHHHTHEHCSAELEKNPCHRIVFHNDIDASCSHNGHIIATKHQCQFCDVLVSQFDFPKVKIDVVPILRNETYDLTFKEKIIVLFSHPEISLRGPPYNLT